MRSGLQQIQAVLERASQPQPEARPVATVQRSFDIEGRSQSGYLGVTSIADVSPPWFPKAAFQSPSRRLKRPALSVDLSVAQVATGAMVQPSPEQQPSPAQPNSAAEAAFTAESLAVLFAQAEAAAPAIAPTMPPATPAAPEPSPNAALDSALTQPPIPLGAIEAGQLPALPHSKPPQLSSHQNSTNPMLPLGLLQDIGKEVIVWQEALKTVHQNIQDLYQEGQIIEGWLEQHPSLPGQYQLCGLDNAGQPWRRSCDPEQLPSVSLAISRYKQLRQLLGEKQRLDHRIQRLSETLTMLRGHLRAY